ncbi:MAG TPA: hypothetical protein VF753_12155 [Terriglobales bacterium]
MWCFIKEVTLRIGAAGITVLVILIACAVAQTGSAPAANSLVPLKIRIVFPQGISTDDIWLQYGMYTPDGIGRYIGLRGSGSGAAQPAVPAREGQGQLVTMGSLPAYYEIDGTVRGKRVERFQALVWAPGCNVMYFDEPEVRHDIEKQFVCTEQRQTTLTGRVRNVSPGGRPARIRASLDIGMSACFMLHTCEPTCSVDCLLGGIPVKASANLAEDGSFTMKLPDFTGAEFDTAILGFRFGMDDMDTGHARLLSPEEPRFRNQLGELIVLRSYPSEVVFVQKQPQPLRRR